MTVWAKLLSLFTVTPIVRLPEEQRLDHAFRNYTSAMQGTERHGLRVAAQIANDPARAARIERREASQTTIDAIVREMQGRR